MNCIFFVLKNFAGHTIMTQNLGRRNSERPVFRNFEIANIKTKKDDLFDNFIYEPLLAPVRKIMALGRKKWPLGVK